MNEEIMNKLFPEYVKMVKQHICPFCQNVVNENDFKDEISRKEFQISGLCQKCQDETFTLDEPEDYEESPCNGCYPNESVPSKCNFCPHN